MKYRKLRIAFSAVYGVLCLLLIALWVRSYSYRDNIQRMQPPRFCNVTSLRGRIEYSDTDVSHRSNQYPFREFQDWNLRSSPARTYLASQITSARKVDYYRSPLRTTIVFPHWLPVVVVGVLAAVPWMYWSKRFSLRTLLLATTLVAILLGLAMWTAT
jgi:hypothetical protein